MPCGSCPEAGRPMPQERPRTFEVFHIPIHFLIVYIILTGLGIAAITFGSVMMTQRHQ